ncbi:MAG: S9 family peptidase [Weeksellaceae bacterium]|nr:S9 family peptidase [Weeksellaceae bacterium]
MKKIWLMCLVMSISAQFALAQGITAEDVAKMRNVTNSAMSPDGRFVAYTLSVPADYTGENSPNSSQLHILNTQNGTSRPYFTTSSVSQITFRPQKNTITFLSRRQGESSNAVYELDINGGEAVKLFAHSSNILAYDWHPDGNQIVFAASERENTPKSSLSYSPQFYEEDFSTRKAFVKNITTNVTAKALDVKGSIYMLAWSPNGQQIAISVAPTSSVDDMFMRQSVKIVNAATGAVTTNIDNKGKLAQIVWAPDNSRLAILGAKDLHDPIEGNIHIVSAQGGGLRDITGDFQGKFERILWKDANAIHFLASEGVATGIGTIRPDGSNRQWIFKSDTHAISNFDRSSGNAYSFVASTPEHPSELFTIADTRRATPQKRTDNNPWLQGKTLGKQEIITYNARDGKYDIQGLLIYPVNYQAGTSYPLINVIHGGPEAHYSNGWLTAYSLPGQMAAGKGYAVFYPNYRGSTGRGNEFTYSSQGDMAGKEFDDIVDGVDHLVSLGIADTKRVGVTGGSYGGYASAWMSTYYSQRFAAAVMFVGISNNISKWGTGDIPEELYLVHSRKRIWDNWQGNLERSPIYYVDRSQTPILIMHGADDPRVHPAQSMELYRHLKVRKPEVPVRLIYYPGEGHGNVNSGSKYDYNLRMLQWFDTYLKTGNAQAEKPSLDLPEKR